MTIVHPFDPGVRVILATNFTWVASEQKRRRCLIAVHSAEDPAKPTSAEAVAGWFARPNPALDKPRNPAIHCPEASSDCVVDTDSLVVCVMPPNISWACGATNVESYNIEISGYAKWTREQWLEQMPMLELAALHLARACGYFGIPAQLLDDEDVAFCMRDNLIERGVMHGALSGHHGGVTTHVQVNRVWRNWLEYGLPKPAGDLSHSDPGPSFPLDVLVNMMKPASGRETPLPPPPRMPSGTAPLADEGPEEFPLK